MKQIRDLLVLAGTKRRRGRKLKKKGGVTIHNVGNNNKGANADANARYQKNSANKAVNGWHFTVDEKEIVRSIPQDEIAEHCGKRLGNDTTVGIEICDNADGDILTATNNAAELAAYLLKAQGYLQAVWKENIFQHNDWSDKDCPAQIRRGRPYSWTAFIAKVNSFMGGAVAPPKPPKGTWTLSRVLKQVQVYWRDPDVITLQTVLRTRGYYKGAIDGKFGAMTDKAVRAFQKTHKLKRDGKVGKQTTIALGGIWEEK